jgi:hypothetical protein
MTVVSRTQAASEKITHNADSRVFFLFRVPIHLLSSGYMSAFTFSALPQSPCLVPPILPKFHYVKRRFPVTSKYRQMHGVLNVDKIKN